MEDKKVYFFEGTVYVFFVVLFLLMTILGATASIWQLVSKSQNSANVSSAFNFISVDVDPNQHYVFAKCDPKDVEVGQLILFNKSVVSGQDTLSIGTLLEFRPDDNFGELVIKDSVSNEEIVRPSTYFLGQLSSDDFFSYSMVGLLNSSIMFFGFTLVPLALLITFVLIHNKKTAQNKTTEPKSKRAKRLFNIGKSNK